MKYTKPLAITGREIRRVIEGGFVALLAQRIKETGVMSAYVTEAEAVGTATKMVSTAIDAAPSRT